MAESHKNIRVRRKKQLIRIGILVVILILLTTLSMGGYYIGNSQVGTSDDGSSSTLTGDEISINAEIFKRWFEAAEKDQLEGEKNEENTTDVGQEKGEEQGSDTTPPNPTPQPPPDPQPTSPPATTNNWWSYPSVINTIPASSVTLTTVVNKGNKLASDYIPPSLTLLQNIPGIRIPESRKGTLYVRSDIIPSLTLLGQQALADGIDLSIVSAYRSYDTQASTYNYWVSYNGGNVDAADQVSARPGHSEHQLGTAVDFSTSAAGDAVGAVFHGTEAATWLAQNAPSYGFKLSYPAGQESVTGYSYESWHWRWWGE